MKMVKEMYENEMRIKQVAVCFLLSRCLGISLLSHIVWVLSGAGA